MNLRYLRTAAIATLVLMSLGACATQNNASALNTDEGSSENASNPARDLLREEEPTPAMEEAEIIEEPAESQLSDRERRFLDRYLDTMTFMVYYDAQTSEEEFLMKASVSQANQFLIEQQFSIVDMDQIDRIQADQAIVDAELSGENQSTLQRIAENLDADVYVDIDATVASGARSNGYRADAQVTLKVFETSTAQLLGTTTYSQNFFSTIDEFDAKSKALQTATYAGMPELVRQTRGQMDAIIRNGIRYILRFQNTSDQRVMRDLRREIASKVISIESTSTTPEASVYELYYIGNKDDVADIVYDAADAVGLFNLTEGFGRRRELVFETGL